MILSTKNKLVLLVAGSLILLAVGVGLFSMYSVKRTMLEEQRRQGNDIDKLKAEPAEQWSSMKRTIFNTIVGAIAGAIASGLVYATAMAQYIK